MSATGKVYIHAIFLLVFHVLVFANGQQTVSCEEASNSTDLQEVLSAMNKAAKGLQSVQSELSYLTIEDPDLLNSKVLRTGLLYYLKDENRSYLRIHFKDLKQDDFKPESRRDEYLFDGIWLTRIDYKLKQIDRFQQATEDSPADVFQLISHNFPLIGFTDSNSINKDFEVTLKQTPQESKNTIHVLLETRSNSPLAKEYDKIDLWVDNKTYLPVRIKAFSIQGDIHDIQFQGLQVNKNLKKAVFTIEKPSGFRENIEPLKSTRK